jgi:hypothetical protein
MFQPLTSMDTGPQDFADWLPPMLVKELRQGLKTHVFVAVFVLVQVAMITLVGLRLTSADGAGADTLDQIMWQSLGAVLLLLMPCLFALSLGSWCAATRARWDRLMSESRFICSLES